jgi:dihydromethanopterin reductase (acceptor)
VPVDISGVIHSELPFNIDRDICKQCDICPPGDQCPKQAITDEPQIELLLCNGCGICASLCQYDAIKGGEVVLRVRDLDCKNVQILKELDEITVLEHPEDIMGIF